MPVKARISPFRTLLLLALSLVCGLSSSASAQSFATWWAWLASLQAQGYAVTQGSAVVFTAAYCQQTDFPSFKSCFNSDYEDPYIQVLPSVGGGYVDPAYGTITSLAANGTTLSQVYQLDTTEALLVIVDLPPAAAYFSYQSYMFTRPTGRYPGGKLSPDPGRALVMGSFSNSIDNIGIQQQSRLGFGQGTVAFMTTANSSLASSLVASFAASGGSPSTLLTDPMGSNLNPGLGSASDDFISVLRYSMPQDTVAGNRANPAADNHTPASSIRMTFPQPIRWSLSSGPTCCRDISMAPIRPICSIRT